MLPADLLPLADVPAASVIALNNQFAAETSELDAASYAALIVAAGFGVAAGDAPDAFMIAFDETSNHPNANLAWFRARHDRFVYVDRIIVSPAARGRGLARRLYAGLFTHAHATGRPIAGCEINVIPANPASDALHAALGFAEIGRRSPKPGKTIRYMRRALTADARDGLAAMSEPRQSDG